MHFGFSCICAEASSEWKIQIQNNRSKDVTYFYRQARLNNKNYHLTGTVILALALCNEITNCQAQ